MRAARMLLGEFHKGIVSKLYNIHRLSISDNKFAKIANFAVEIHRPIVYNGLVTVFSPPIDSGRLTSSPERSS